MPGLLPTWRRRFGAVESRRKRMQAFREMARRVLSAASPAPRVPLPQSSSHPFQRTAVRQPPTPPQPTTQRRHNQPAESPLGVLQEFAGFVATDGQSWSSGDLALDAVVESTLRDLAAVTNMMSPAETTLVIVQRGNDVYAFVVPRGNDVFAFVVPVTPADMALYHLTRIHLAALVPAEENLGLTQEQIRAIPSRRFNDSHAGPSANSSEHVCTICLCDYEKGDHLRDLGCDHAFHQECIDPWLEVDNSCPLCKTPPSPACPPATLP